LIRATEGGEICLDGWSEQHWVLTSSIGCHDKGVPRALGETRAGISYGDISEKNGES